MNKIPGKYWFHWLALVAIQLLLLNHSYLSSWIYPNILILAILILPLSTNRIQVILFSFFTGFVLDVFNYGFGLNMFVFTFIGYLRYFIIRLLTQAETEDRELLSIKYKGFRWFITYSGILTFSGIVLYFFLEQFSFRNFPLVLAKSFTSAIFSLGLMTLYQLLLISNKKTK